MKKYVALLLSILLCLSAIPAFAYTVLSEEEYKALSAEEQFYYLDYLVCNAVYDNITSFDDDYAKSVVLAEHVKIYGAMYSDADDAAKKETYQKMYDLLNNLETIANPDEQRIYLWNSDNIPTKTEYTDNSSHKYHSDPDFQPYLLPVLVPEGTEIRGAVIIVPGGDRGTAAIVEGSDIAAEFSKLGYQCFIAINRQNNNPWSGEESGVDIARAVRYVRANAETYGIDPEQIAICGSSNGGMTCMYAIEYYAGTATAKDHFENYQPDALDEISAAPNAFINEYGLANLVDEANASLYPPVFFVGGEQDSGYARHLSILSAWATAGITVEAHSFAGAPHGFGAHSTATGECYENTKIWPSLADTFMQKVYQK